MSDDTPASFVPDTPSAPASFVPDAPAQGPSPIKDTSTASARPSLGSRLLTALKQGGPSALGEELGNSTREAIGDVSLPGLHKTLGEGLKDLGQMANMAGTEGSMLAGPETAEMMAGKLPSTARAGATLNEVMGAAKNIPVDLSAPGDAALKAAKLAESGGSMPKVIRDFLRRATDPGKSPMTYEEARDFYSNATRISADEAGRLTSVMKKQLTDFTAALKESTREAAAKAGKGEQFSQAMNEYRSAIKLKEAHETIIQMAKDALTKIVIPTGAGYAILKNLIK